jgi:hypothetical protein
VRLALNTVGLVAVSITAALTVTSWLQGKPASYRVEVLAQIGWLTALLHVRSYLK